MVLPLWRRAPAPRQHGALLVIDETHTISTGYAGYSGQIAWSQTCWCWQTDCRRATGGGVA